MISIAKTINNDFVIVKSEDQEHYWSGSKWSDQDDAVIYKTWAEATQALFFQNLSNHTKFRKMEKITKENAEFLIKKCLGLLSPKKMEEIGLKKNEAIELCRVWHNWGDIFKQEN